MQPCDKETRIISMEKKIRDLELFRVSDNKDIVALTTNMKDLTTEVRIFVRLIVGIIIAVLIPSLGYLIVYWVKGGGF